MAEIFDPPAGIAVPQFNWRDLAENKRAEEKFIHLLKEFCLKRNNSKNVGEVIKFPAADGYALYMVASMKPVQLVHIPLGDAWHFQYTHLLKAKDVQDKIDHEKVMAKLFENKAQREG